jgi:uncharacterized membrane protein
MGQRLGRDGMMRMNPAERRQLMQLLHEFREDTSDLKNRVRELERRAIELLQEDPVPRAQVDSLLHEISNTHFEISRKATDKLIEAKSHLSPEQQKLFYQAILRAGPGMPGMPGGKGRFRKGRMLRQRLDSRDSTHESGI